MGDYFTVISLIVIGCGLLAWLTVVFRQPVIVAYFAAGLILAPALLRIEGEFVPTFVSISSRLGITLLLFMAGMVLHPDRILKFFRTALLMTAAGALITWMLVFAVLYVWGVEPLQSHICGLATMFSSTILVVKLLPTTTLHQRRMGALCIAILIAEDLLAVVLITLLRVGQAFGPDQPAAVAALPLKAVFLIVAAFLGERYVLRPMFRRADRYPEVLIILSLAWGLGAAAIAEKFGLSAEIGAFIGGVSLARNKVAYVIAEQLKPLRDFFLMFFFFTLGLKLDLTHIGTAWMPALALGVLIVTLRPVYGSFLLRLAGEERAFSRETGLRLGQASEFGLIVSAVAMETGFLSSPVAAIIQIAIIVSMVLSSYVVTARLPTPLGPRPQLQLD